ncbi:NATT3 protein, partial [Cisticola juncidis]|nr:NATT3 protein [Cisticola juncidis]
TEFVCSTQTPTWGCNIGAFDPERGRGCVFTLAEQELSSPEFRLLLNPGGFEALSWADASFGRTPAGAVEGCPRSDLFVGRSRDQQALFVAVQGGEVWYKWYQVLVARHDPAGLCISELRYNGSAALHRAEPAEL